MFREGTSANTLIFLDLTQGILKEISSHGTSLSKEDLIQLKRSKQLILKGKVYGLISDTNSMILSIYIIFIFKIKNIYFLIVTFTVTSKSQLVAYF